MRSMKIQIFAIMLLAMLLSLAGCSDNWDAPYASLQESGHTVSIRFDINGGLFAGTKDVSVVDVFSLSEGIVNSDGTVGFYLLTPEDPRRAEGAFAASRNGYFLAGWYTHRTPRVDANGQALDDYGVPVDQSGRPQGYTYSGKWDFSSDTLNIDPNGSYQADTPALTLYAAWVPYINYEIYTVDESGQASLLSSVQSVDLDIPRWNERTGKLDMKSFPKRDGFTFNGAYLDASLTQPITDTVSGEEMYVDYETGTVSTESVRIYTDWLDGTWFQIYTAQQLYDNARLDGNYKIMNDLNFTDKVWSPTLVKGKFSGRIYGNGHTITGISATQADNTKVFGGLFGSIEAGAEIRDLILSDVTFTIEAGSRMQGASFGLLTGVLSPDAVIGNVEVTGELLISENCYPQPDYTIGLLCGSGNAEGVEYTIACRPLQEATALITVTVNDDDTVTVTFANP